MTANRPGTGLGMRNRQCATCGELRPRNDFYSYENNGRTYSANSCKRCYIERARQKRIRRRERLGTKPRGSRKPGDMTIKERLAFYAKLKTDRGCADCGRDDDWRILQFDHLPEHEKLFNISQAIKTTTGFTDAQIAAEVAKCEVVCADCHVRRTLFRLGPADRPGWIYR